MSPRQSGRTQVCDRHLAKVRLDDAYAQRELAEVGSLEDSPAGQKAATSCAVLAGIAASDAACCALLGRCSRSSNHADAVSLLKQIVPDGPEAARELERLLAFKSAAQYGLYNLRGTIVVSSLRQMNTLIAFAERSLGR